MYAVVKKRSTMNKLTIRIVALCSVVSGGMTHATAEFRTPIILERGEMHFRLPEPLEETWWFDPVTENVPGCNRWCGAVWDFWAGAYSRWADRAFFKAKERDCDCLFSDVDDRLNNCDDDHGTTRKTVGLSQLFFGRESFRGVDAFAEGEASTELLVSNPVLNFARIFPDFTYSEQGVYWGLYTRWDFGCEDKFHVGTRISIPFKVIEVQQRGCVLEEGLADVAERQPITFNANLAPNQVDYAYRLDFLSSLVLPVSPVGGVIQPPVALVQYGNGIPGNADERTIIATQFVDAPTPAGTGEAAINVQPGAYVIRRVDETAPDAPFRKTASQVTGALAPDGSGGGNNAVLFFELGTDYADGLGEDPAAQADLWVVPRRFEAVDQLVPSAVTIGDVIQQVIEDNEGILTASAVETFRRLCDIDLCADRRVEGLGDLMTEVFFGFGYPDDAFLDVMIAALWPTGKKPERAGDVFFQSTGHWRHFELRLGMQGGIKPVEWFAFQFWWLYNHDFERTQPKAAPFAGASVRNIGPNIDSKVKWDYWTLNTQFNFFHPCNPELGVMFGYELFAKRHDRIRGGCPDFECGRGIALDCLGQQGDLDFRLLERGTSSMTHKLSGEIFHRVAFWELTAGASRVVAGRQAMQETEIHLALRLYF
jgi:hypothetical protein